MIIDKELVKKIRTHFNLNIYETKVWIALLNRGIASAGEIAEMSGVPRSRTYDVLESLEKRGYAIAKLGKPVKYIAVKPTTVIEKLKTNALKDADEKVKNLSKLKDTKEYEELQELYDKGVQPVRHQELSGAIKGKSNVFNHVKELINSADSEVIICTLVEDVNNKSRIYGSIFDILKNRNIDVRIALSGDEKEINKINKRYRLKAKKLDLNSSFFIIDGEQILFLTDKENPKNSEETGIWINSEFFVSSLSYLFDKAWKSQG
jgi:sugar-specific transcriptional regulator TrmB